MASDIEEDFPLNGGSDKLAKIFEDNTFDDISFKFSPPKHSSGRTYKSSQNTVPLKVIYGKTVEAFQMKMEGYKSEGKVGLAIIGNDEYCYYQLYMYRSDERKVASAEINFQFLFMVQEHNYASFKDSLGIQWSVHFDKPSDLINFSKEIALARWRSAPSCQCKLLQEAFKGSTEHVVQKSDTVKVNYTVYKLSSENDILEESSQKVITAPATSIQWEINLVGACLKSRRFIIIPSQQCENKVDLSLPAGVYVMLDLEIVEIIPLNVINSLTSCSLSIQNESSKSTAKKKELSNLSERISRTGYALPNLEASETDCSSVLSEEMKNESQKLLTPVSSDSTIKKEESDHSSDVCDVTVNSQFNMLFSEVRTSNSEIRMNIGRVNDKIDTVISKMERIPQVNKIIPSMEKIEDIGIALFKLVEQNSTMMSLLEKNALPNLQSTINDIVQLKKRNSELEGLLDVAGSTSQILKEKINELNHKILLMEKTKGKEESYVCAHCNGTGDKMVKVLEENVRVLEEKNLKLIEVTKELEQQKQELSEHTMSAIQGHSNQELSFQLRLLEKDSTIEKLERELDKLNSEIKKRYSKQAFEKEITEVAKALMNKAYKTLKSVARDSTLIDHSYADALRDMTKDYLENLFGQNCHSLSENERPLNSCEEVASEGRSFGQPGKIPSTLNTVPLPVPKPRKPTNTKKTSDLVQGPQQNIIDNKLNEKTENNETPSGSSNLIINNDLEGNKIANQLNQVTSETNPDQNLVISSSNTQTVENNNTLSVKFPCATADIVDGNRIVDQEIDTFLDDNNRLPCGSKCSETESISSPNLNSLSSSFYPPLIPRTPPLIFDDSSD